MQDAQCIAHTPN